MGSRYNSGMQIGSPDDAIGLQRDRITWLAYLMLSLYAFLAGMLGPILPYLRVELSLSYTVGGLHLSLFAVGMILAGLMIERIVQRFGRRAVLWGGGLGSIVGALSLAFSRLTVWTLAGAFVIGLCGAAVQIMVQAILSDRHGERRMIPLTEANIGASVGSTLAPLLVGGFEHNGLGWRLALYVAIASIFFLAGIYGRDPILENRLNQPAAINRSRLPFSYWAYWGVIIFLVAIEWCMFIWCPDFLEKIIGLSRDQAVMTMSVFQVANVLGRILGSRLTRKIPVQWLLLGALIITLAGFPLFWLAAQSWLSVTGLFLAGFGIANFFPFGMSVAISQAPGQANTASARISLAVGLAIFLGPFILGWIADQVGIRAAYTIVPMLLVVACAVTLVTNRLVVVRRMS